jgi:acetyltransferase-like isoleucine patch superfamily enzyme
MRRRACFLLHSTSCTSPSATTNSIVCGKDCFSRPEAGVIASPATSVRVRGQGPDAVVGENCFVADGVSLEAGARVGDNVALWSNVVVGHHAQIGNHCWIAAGTAIGGGTVIGDRCFVALNATIGNEVVVGADCILGARTLLTKSVADKSVLVEKDTELFRLDSDRFLRMSRLR